MKKAILALPLLGAAGWAGATMYAGNEAESAYDELLEQLRVQHGLHVEPMSYEKKFLGSQVKTIVNGHFGSLSQTKDLPEPFKSLSGRFVLNHDITHGPVVLSNGLKTLAGKIKTTLDMESLDPDFARTWQQACACDEPLVLDSEISIQGSYSHLFDMKPLDWQNGETRVSFDGIQSKSSVDADKQAVNNGQIGKLIIDGVDGSYVRTEAGSWQMSGVEHVKNILLGEAAVLLPSLEMSIEDEKIELSHIKLDVKTALENAAIGSYFDFSVASIHAKDVQLEDTHLLASVTGFEAEKLVDMTAEFSRLDMSSEGSAVELLTLYRNMITPGLGISYGFRTNHTDSGAIDASLAVAYNPAAGVSFDDMHTAGDLLQAMKADFSLSIDEDLLLMFPPDISQNPMLPGVFSKTASQYSLNANLAHGIAELNGAPIPLDMFTPQLSVPLPSIEEVALTMQAVQQVD